MDKTLFLIITIVLFDSVLITQNLVLCFIMESLDYKLKDITVVMLFDHMFDEG